MPVPLLRRLGDSPDIFCYFKTKKRALLIMNSALLVHAQYNKRQ